VLGYLMWQNSQGWR